VLVCQTRATVGTEWGKLAGRCFIQAEEADAMMWIVLLFVVAIIVVLWRDDTRRRFVSVPAMRAISTSMPAMSQTERDALEAGTVWWEGELFSGRPDWNRLLSLPWPELSREEREFLSDEAAALCGMVDDWESTRQLDMP